MKQQTLIVNRPISFSGTPEQARANFQTHAFVDWYGDVRCQMCDCRPSHETAYYPCGTDVPRETVTHYEDGSVSVVAD